MQYEEGICRQCELEGDLSEKIIVNRKHWSCPEHNRIRLDNQSGETRMKLGSITKRRYSETFQYSTKWGFTREMDMFLHIFENGPRVSTISGKPIYFHPSNFAHILAKGLNKYPHYRLNPENIMVMTQDEHHLVDNGTEKQRVKYEKENPPANFSKFYKEVERLKKEYTKEFPS